MNFNTYVLHYKEYLDTNYLVSNQPCEDRSYLNNPNAVRQFCILRDKNGKTLAQVRQNGTVILF